MHHVSFPVVQQQQQQKLKKKKWNGGFTFPRSLSNFCGRFLRQSDNLFRKEAKKAGKRKSINLERYIDTRGVCTGECVTRKNFLLFFFLMLSQRKKLPRHCCIGLLGVARYTCQFNVSSSFFPRYGSFFDEDVVHLLSFPKWSTMMTGVFSQLRALIAVSTWCSSRSSFSFWFLALLFCPQMNQSPHYSRYDSGRENVEAQFGFRLRHYGRDVSSRIISSVESRRAYCISTTVMVLIISNVQQYDRFISVNSSWHPADMERRRHCCVGSGREARELGKVGCDASVLLTTWTGPGGGDTKTVFYFVQSEWQVTDSFLPTSQSPALYISLPLGSSSLLNINAPLLLSIQCARCSFQPERNNRPPHMYFHKIYIGRDLDKCSSCLSSSSISRHSRDWRTNAIGDLIVWQRADVFFLILVLFLFIDYYTLLSKAEFLLAWCENDDALFISTDFLQTPLDLSPYK